GAQTWLSELVLRVNCRRQRRLVREELLSREEPRNFGSRRLQRVRRVDQVCLNAHRPIAAYRSRRGLPGFGDPAKTPHRLNAVQTLDTNRDNRRQRHEALGSWEKRLIRKMAIVFVQQSIGQLHELDARYFKALVLKALENAADQTALNRVGLDKDESAFHSDSFYLR